MLILHRPYKLERKVIVEKTKNINYELEDFEPMRTRRNISIIISILTTIILNYISICCISLELNIINWLPTERVVILIASVIGTFLVMFYCSNHMVRNDNERVVYLSENWFKKLFTILIFYLFSVGIVFLILSFCTMSLDFTKLELSNRALMFFISYLCCIGLCSLCYWNNLPFILKIEKQ